MSNDEHGPDIREAILDAFKSATAWIRTMNSNADLSQVKRVQLADEILLWMERAKRQLERAVQGSWKRIELTFGYGEPFIGIFEIEKFLQACMAISDVQNRAVGFKNQEILDWAGFRPVDRTLSDELQVIANTTSATHELLEQARTTDLPPERKLAIAFQCGEAMAEMDHRLDSAVRTSTNFGPREVVEGFQFDSSTVSSQLVLIIARGYQEIQRARRTSANLKYSVKKDALIKLLDDFDKKANHQKARVIDLLGADASFKNVPPNVTPETIKGLLGL
jgi:hypothetical protein